MPELLEDTEALAAFVPEWKQLWAADPAATPFQSPAWLLPWWHHFGQPQMRAVRIDSAAGCIGFLPFYVYVDPHSGQRQLLLVGAGTSDYLDGVFAPACTVAQVREALQWLLRRDDWDTLLPTQLRPESKLYQAVSGLAGAERFTGESCCRMPAASMGSLPVKIRRNAMYYRNRAQRGGALRLVMADGGTCLAAFDVLQRMHTRRWQQSGLPGVLEDPLVLAWHREALPLLAADGLLRLCTLQLDGEVLGVLYALIDPPARQARTQYFYITAYSPDHADLRPGTLLLALAIEEAANEGVATIDMLRGEEAYKALWHLERTPTYGFTLHSRTYKNERSAPAGATA